MVLHDQASAQADSIILTDDGHGGYEKFRNELKRGDKVVTIGGIYGTIDEIKETTVLIKVDGEVKLRVAKNAINKDFSEDTAQPQK